MTYKAPSSTNTEPGLITLTGDLGGTATSPIVESIQGNSLNLGLLGATQDGYVLTWTNSASQWQARAPGSTIAQGIDYQFSNSSSDISGYNQLLDVATGSQSDLSASVTSGGGKTLIKAFATTSNLPGISVIPAGLWEFNYYGYASLTGAFTTQLVFDVYTRTTGGAENLLFSVTGSNLNVTSINRFTISFNVTTDTFIDDTQRLVIKVSAQTSNIVAVTAHFVFDGTANTSLVRTPISGDAIQLGGDLSGTTTSATIVTISGSAPVNVVNGAISFGSTVASSGAIRLPNATNIMARNANNTADITVVSTDSSNNISVGAGTNIANVTLNASTGNLVKFDINSVDIITVSSNTVSLAQTGTAYTISQATSPSDTATNNLTIASQAPFASASTHVTPGNLIFNVPSPISGSTYGQHLFQRGGTTYLSLTPDSTPSAIISAPVGNLTLKSAGGDSLFIESDNFSIRNAAGSSVWASATSSGFTWDVPTFFANATVQFTNSTVSPTINQATPASDVATTNLTIQSQAPFASASTNKNPGNILLNIPSPVAGGTNGYVGFQQGGSTVVTMGVDPSSTTFAGLFAGVPSASNYMIMSTGANTYVGAPSGSLILTSGGTSVSSLVVASTGVQINTSLKFQTNVFNDATATATTTTNATLTTIYTDSAIPASNVYDYVVTVVGVNTSTLDTYRADFSFTYLNNAGSLSAIGAAATPLNVRTSGSANTWGGASIATSGTQVLVQVTGLAATNIDWNCSVNRLKVS